jgi:nitrogenase molybdenum-iron protein beta chain
VGNTRELKRILGLFGVDYTILSDNSDTFDSPNTGEFKMYNGLTTLADTAPTAINAEGSFFFQKYSTPKTQEFHGEGMATKRPTTSVPLASKAPTSS